MLKSEIEPLQLHRLNNHDLMCIIQCRDEDLDLALRHIQQQNGLKLTESQLLKNLNHASCTEHKLSPKKHKSFSAGLGFATLPIDAVAFIIGSVSFIEAVAIAIAGLMLSVFTFGLTFLLTHFYIKKKKDLLVNFFILNEIKKAAAQLIEQRVNERFPGITPSIPTLSRDHPKRLDAIDKILQKISRPLLISTSIALPLAGALFFSYFASSSSSMAVLGLGAAAIATPGVNVIFFCVIAISFLIAAYLAFRCYKEEKPWKEFKQTVAKERTEVEQLTKKATALYTLAYSAEKGSVKPTTTPELAISPINSQTRASATAALPKSPGINTLSVTSPTAEVSSDSQPDFPYTTGFGANHHILMAKSSSSENLYAPSREDAEAEERQPLLNS